jgi:hypothetical protein
MARPDSAFTGHDIPDFVPAKLTIRCFAQGSGDVWEAFSLELGLAAQASSLEEVKAKLESMIETYVCEALTVDREHAQQLLSRKATWSVFAKYYFICALGVLNNNGRKRSTTYREPMPLHPRACPA